MLFTYIICCNIIDYSNIKFIDLVREISYRFDIEIRANVKENYEIEYICLSNKNINEVIEILCQQLKLEYKIDNNIIYINDNSLISHNYILKCIINADTKILINNYLASLNIKFVWIGINNIYITCSEKDHINLLNYFNNIEKQNNNQVYIAIKIVQISTSENNTNALHQIFTNLFTSINELNTNMKIKTSINLIPFNQIIAGAAGVLNKHKKNDDICINFECSGGIYIQNYKTGYISHRDNNNIGFDVKISINTIQNDFINLDITHKYANNTIYNKENNEVTTTLNINIDKKYIISSQLFKIKGVIKKYFFNQPILKKLFFFLNEEATINNVNQYFIIIEAQNI